MIIIDNMITEQVRLYSTMLVAGRSTLDYTERQWPLSMVHSTMRVKSAQAGEGGGTYKVVVYAPAERADTLPLFLLYPYMYPVGLAHNPGKGNSHLTISKSSYFCEV